MKKVAVAVVANSLVSRLTCYFPETSGLERLTTIAPEIEKTRTSFTFVT